MAFDNGLENIAFGLGSNLLKKEIDATSNG